MQRASPRAKIVVYSGLTLSKHEIEAIVPDALVRPPVKQFDLLVDIREGYHVVVIVDGVFHQTPAVSPSEIMDALRRGLLVYGCSSMGALRAAELHRHGMRGVGEIFEWVKSTPGFRDDFPAQTFGVDGERIVPLSMPYVDFVFNLRRLRAAGRLSTRDYGLLERIFRDLYYPDRTLAAVVAALKPRRLDLIPLVTHAMRRMPSQKRIDALATLKRVQSDLRAVAKANTAFAGSVALLRSKHADRSHPAGGAAP